MKLTEFIPQNLAALGIIETGASAWQKFSATDGTVIGEANADIATSSFRIHTSPNRRVQILGALSPHHPLLTRLPNTQTMSQIFSSKQNINLDSLALEKISPVARKIFTDFIHSRDDKSIVLTRIAAAANDLAHIKALNHNIKSLQRQRKLLKTESHELLTKDAIQNNRNFRSALREEEQELLTLRSDLVTKQISSLKQLSRDYKKIHQLEDLAISTLVHEAISKRNNQESESSDKILVFAQSIFSSVFEELENILTSILQETEYVSKDGQTHAKSVIAEDFLGFRNYLSPILELHRERRHYISIQKFFSGIQSPVDKFKNLPAALPLLTAVNGELESEFQRAIGRSHSGNAGLASVYVPFWGTGEVRGTRVLLPLNIESALSRSDTINFVFPGATTLKSTAVSSVNTAEKAFKADKQWQSLVLMPDFPFHGAGAKLQQTNGKFQLNDFINWMCKPIRDIKNSSGRSISAGSIARSYGAAFILQVALDEPDLFKDPIISVPFAPGQDWLDMWESFVMPSIDYPVNKEGYEWANDPKIGLRHQWTFLQPKHIPVNHPKILLFYGFFDSTYPSTLNYSFRHPQTPENLPLDQVWHELARINPNIIVAEMPTEHFVDSYKEPIATEMVAALTQNHLSDPSSTAALLQQFTPKIKTLKRLRLLKSKLTNADDTNESKLQLVREYCEQINDVEALSLLDQYGYAALYYEVL